MWNVLMMRCCCGWQHVATNSWSPLPDCLIRDGSIMVLNGRLTTVGGEIFSLTEESKYGRRWSMKYPPMPTKRKWTTALCTRDALIVAGGVGEGGALSTVEVMNIKNHRWFTAADLPQPMYRASATICRDIVSLHVGRS